MLTIGSLFTGYGGLDMAVPGKLAWYSEIEPAACKVLNAHYPGVNNLGDITQLDWSTVPPVDILTGGYPCQPFSNAGKRKGANDERHLWPYVRDAISAIRPRYVVLENVRGHLSMGFADVLKDFASVGYSARWGLVRAADAGAPHNRARLFVVAYPGGRQLAGSAERWRFSESVEYGFAFTDADEPSSQARAGRSRTGDTGRREPLERGGQIATYPSSQRYGSGQRPAGVGRVDSAHEGSARQRERSRQKFGTGSVADVANTCGERRNAQRTEPARQLGAIESDGYSHARWGQYGRAIERWQHVIGRPAPAPTVRRNDRDRLSPAFVEWMMGLPEGHVTGHGLSPSQELKMLGNGVVPQQARLALTMLGAL